MGAKKNSKKSTQPPIRYSQIHDTNPAPNTSLRDDNALEEKTSRPITIAIIGPPRSGKTAVALAFQQTKVTHNPDTVITSTTYNQRSFVLHDLNIDTTLASAAIKFVRNTLHTDANAFLCTFNASQVNDDIIHRISVLNAIKQAHAANKKTPIFLVGTLKTQQDAINLDLQKFYEWLVKNTKGINIYLDNITIHCFEGSYLVPLTITNVLPIGFYTTIHNQTYLHSNWMLLLSRNFRKTPQK